MIAKSLFVAALLLASATAKADKWIPYTDGRVGGCFLNENGNLYGCTPQPQKAAPVRSREDSYRHSDGGDRQTRLRNQQLEQENSQLLQLERDRQMQYQRQEEQRQRQNKAVIDYYDSQSRAQQAARGAALEREWKKAHAACSGQNYDAFLKKSGIKRVQNVPGMCKPTNGSGTYFECPPGR